MNTSIKRRLSELSMSLSMGGGKQRRKKKRHVGDWRQELTSQSNPSMKYFDDPECAPTVRRWRSLFPKAEVLAGRREGHRTVVKLCCRVAGDNEPVFGLFVPGTHRIAANSARSVAQSERLNAAIRCIERMRPRAYQNGEKADSQTLNYVCLSEERATCRVSVVLVFNASSRFSGVDDLAAALRLECTKDRVELHSIHAHLNAVSPHDNAIYSRKGIWAQIWPKASVESFEWPISGIVKERLFDNGPVLHFAPPTFRQANLEQFAAIVSRVGSFVPPSASVVELYAGVGTIGAHLTAARVVASDENPYNAHCATLTGAVAYETKPAHVVAKSQLLDLADVIVVDPPRKGLCPCVLQKLARMPRRNRSAITLAYISCGFQAFQRDLCALVAANWRIIFIEGHLLFPGADHVETLAIFTSSSCPPGAPLISTTVPNTTNRKKKRHRHLIRHTSRQGFWRQE